MNGADFLLDTNVVIGFLRGDDAAGDLMTRHGASPARLAVSQITRMERLGFPELTEEARGQIEALLSAITVILLDERIEAAAIALRRRTRLKLPDAIIAATAQTHGLRLLTFARACKLSRPIGLDSEDERPAAPFRLIAAASSCL
jgi:predicted nucleic acid-binding protein